MRWTTALFFGAILAVLLAGVGIAVQTWGVLFDEFPNSLEVSDAQWPSPFERPIKSIGENRDMVIQEGDQGLWYFASGAVFFLTLASLPMLWVRERETFRS
jgi:hypothetical protein